jgi:hypothetical protein
MAGMARREGDVAGWMPILRQNNPPTVTHQTIHDGQNRIGIWYCESTSRAEVVLDVDNDEDGIQA